MQINNPGAVNPTNATSTSTTRTDNAPSNPAPHITPTSAPAVTAQDYDLMPSFELLSLNAVLTQVPPVRQDVISETIRRLAAGDLQSPSALEQTANAILGD